MNAPLRFRKSKMAALLLTAAATTTTSSLSLILWTRTSRAAEEPAKPAVSAAAATTLTAKLKTDTIDGILERLNKNYVFPETAKKMESAIRERAKKGEYDAVTDGQKMAELLTEHLQAVSKDKHLRVRFSEKPLPANADEEQPPTAEEREQMRRWAAGVNFGFDKVERLPGNIGYLNLRGFMPADFAGETCAAAMNFLSNTDALILDLRQNGGGEPAMVALLCSYLFGEEPVHLNDLYFRPTDKTEEFWTLKSVPGKRYVGKDVYVLTSNRTFSGAEECAYNLKNLKRATIVGETTGGGAHPGGTERINDHFAVFVPSGRAINPITKTNWEGTGVAPDVSVPAGEALLVAHTAALKKRMETIANPEQKLAFQAALDKLQGELDAMRKK